MKARKGNLGFLIIVMGAFLIVAVVVFFIGITRQKQDLNVLPTTPPISNSDEIGTLEKELNETNIESPESDFDLLENEASTL